jgi:hypothetical protein
MSQPAPDQPLPLTKNLRLRARVAPPIVLALATLACLGAPGTPTNDVADSAPASVAVSDGNHDGHLDT